MDSTPKGGGRPWIDGPFPTSLAEIVSMLKLRVEANQKDLAGFDCGHYSTLLDPIIACLSTWLKHATAPCKKNPKYSLDAQTKLNGMCVRLESYVKCGTPDKLLDAINFLIKNAPPHMRNQGSNLSTQFDRISTFRKALEILPPELTSPIVAPPPAIKRAASPSFDSPDPDAELPSKVLVLPSTDDSQTNHDSPAREDSVLPSGSAEHNDPNLLAPAEPTVEMLDIQQSDENAKSDAPGQIPPLFIKTPPNWSSFMATLNSLVSTRLVARTIGDSVKIHPKSIDDFRALQDYLASNKFDFATFHLKSERPKKIAIRGLPHTIPSCEIATDLAAKGIEVHKCYNLKRRGTREPLNIYVVELLPHPNWDSIYSINEILSIRVFIRKFDSRGPRQCHACNRFGHSSYNCNYPPRCLKCAGAHAPADCPLDRKAPPTCCNCSGAHTANFSGCPAAPRNKPPRPKAPSGVAKRPAPASSSEEAPAAATEPAFVQRQVSYAAKAKAAGKRTVAPRERLPPVAKQKVTPPVLKWPPGPSPFCLESATDSASPAAVIIAPENAPAPLKALMSEFNELLQRMLALCARIHAEFS